MTIRSLLIFLFVVAGLAASCHKPIELHAMCVRYVDAEGYLRGRTAHYNNRGADMVRDQFMYATEGHCIEKQQGPTRRVAVCLVASSSCAHDRDTNVWADEVEAYFKRYPESYRGKCKGDCAKHADDCLDERFHGPKDFYLWRMWMREMERGRRRR